MAETRTPGPVKIGVLALQGSFREHVAALKRLGVDAVEVKKPEQLKGLGGLIIPGGESTTMARVAERNGLIPALKEFCESGKATWGTCAGLIFLADRALGQKLGGQALLGGLDCTVHRNFFGSQINSFETELAVPSQMGQWEGPETFRAVFIRAPAVVETGAGVEVLAEYKVPPGTTTGEVEPANGNELEKVAVAVKQGQVLATAFHPELTSDLRWHKLFVQMVEENMLKQGLEDHDLRSTDREQGKAALLARPPDKPADLPVFDRTDSMKVEHGVTLAGGNAP